MQIGCLRSLDDLDALYAFMSTVRNKLSYSDFTSQYLNKNANNNNDHQHAHSLGLVGLRIALYTIAMVASLVGNVLLIAVIVCNRFMHKSTNYFVLNLAVCDLAIVASCMWVQIVVGESKEWTLGSLFCKVNSFMQMVSILASVFTLVAISCDRFVAVVYPLRTHLSHRATFLCICSMWALSALIALPAFYYRSYSEQHWSDFVQRQCDDVNWPITLVTNELGCVVEVTRVSKRVYFTAVIVLLFFLPMLVLLLTSTLMIRKLIVPDKHIAGELANPCLLADDKKKQVLSYICFTSIFVLLCVDLFSRFVCFASTHNIGN